jgi:hypothetical protein
MHTATCRSCCSQKNPTMSGFCHLRGRLQPQLRSDLGELHAAQLEAAQPGRGAAIESCTVVTVRTPAVGQGPNNVGTNAVDNRQGRNAGPSRS